MHGRFDALESRSSPSIRSYFAYLRIMFLLDSLLRLDVRLLIDILFEIKELVLALVVNASMDDQPFSLREARFALKLVSNSSASAAKRAFTSSSFRFFSGSNVVRLNDAMSLSRAS